MERSTSPRRRCFPCGGESPRTIQFEDYPDGNIPQYVALSCSWGDETEAMDLQEIVQVDFDWALLSLRTNEYQAAMISMWRNDVIWNHLPLDELSTYESENLANKESELDRLYSWANVLDTTRFSKNIFHSFGSTSEAQIFLECCTRRGQNYDRSSWIWCQTRASLGQISDDFADGLLCKDNKSNFLRSPNRISLAEVIRLLEGVRLRCYGFIPEAHRPLFVKTTNLLIGDGESGPQAGPPSMGREDDDDDDCVGFHRFSRLNRSSKMVEAGAQWHTRLNVCNLHKHSQCATIPKYGPPKRDPVAAAISGPVRQSIDASTLSTWRDVISRTCGEGADLYSTEAKVWQGSSRQGSSWQGGGIRTNCTNRSAGFFLRAH